MDGVRAGRQSGGFFEHGPQLDATFVTADDGGFGTMQLELVKAELHRTNQELSICVEPHFVAAAMRIPKHDLSDWRGAVSFREQRGKPIIRANLSASPRLVGRQLRGIVRCGDDEHGRSQRSWNQVERPSRNRRRKWKR